MLEYTIENPETGAGGTLTADDVMQQMRQQGSNPVGVTPDGQFVQIQDSQGAFQVKIADALTGLGWKINDIAPKTAIEDSVQPMLRAQLASLPPNDEIRRLYLVEKLQGTGLDPKNLVGQGTDWYVYHPESNQYYAVTNKRGLDTSDFASAAAQAPGLIGGALGGAAGAAAGSGALSLPAAMAGGAAGQFAGDALSKGVLSAMDPQFARALGANAEESLMDMGKSAAVSGAGAGLFKALPMGIQALRGQGSQAGRMVEGMLNAGPLSTAARYGGGLAEETGRIASTVAKPFSSPGIAADIAASQMPVVGQMQLGGVLSQAPRGAVRLGQKAYEKFATPEAAKRAATSIPRDAFGKSSAEDIGAYWGQKYGQSKVLPMSARTEARAMRDAGVPLSEAMRELKIQQSLPFRETGAKIGRGIDTLGNYGQKLDQAASAMAQKTAGGVYGLGRGTQSVGAGLNRTGRFLQPVENRAYTNLGAEEALADPYEQYLRQRRNKLSSRPGILANIN